MSGILSLIDNSKVVFCLGAGGVGKTTTAIALAVLAALNGKKVGLLSIDPAKRLAAALGLSLQGDLKKIPLDLKLFPGEIDAAMLDQKAVFDEIVKRFTKDSATIQKILTSPLYISAAKGFGGAIEYMALAKLETMLESNKYDLIVIDTPPDAHALDFLSKPDILSGFIENKVMSWLIKPILLANKFGFGKIMNFGEKLSLGIAKVTGFASLRILAEFLTMMQDVIFGLHDVGVKITKTLKDKDTSFVLISTLNTAPIRSAVSMIKQLKDQQLHLNQIILNRCLPKPVINSMAAASNLKLSEASKVCLTLLEKRRLGEENLKQMFLQNIRLLLGDFSFLQYVEEQKLDLHSMSGLIDFAKALDTA